MSGVLLDTCALIFLLQPEGLEARAQRAFEQADEAGEGVYVSPISAWEIGLLVARGRIALSTPPQVWFDDLLQAGLGLAPLTPDILIQSSFLPGDLHQDPADRILAATARSLRLRLMTRARPLLAYAEKGHLQAIAC